MVEPDIGEDGSGTEVCLVAEDGIPDVVEVGDLRLVEDEAVLELAGVAEHHAVAHHDVLADVGAVTDMASLADPRRPLDHRAVLDHRAGSYVDGPADEGLADELAVDAWLQSELEIGRDLCDRLPGISDIFKNDAVLSAVEVEEGIGGEHGRRMKPET